MFCVLPLKCITFFQITLLLDFFSKAPRKTRRLVCGRGEGVQGVLTLNCGGVAQTCHDDRVAELKEQLGKEEVDGEGQEGQVKEEGRDRVKENAP